MCDDMIAADSLAYNQSPRMRLQSTRSDHVVHSTLNHLTQSQRLVLARHYKYNLPRIHDRLHTHGQCHAWDRVEIVVEESAVVEDGLVR